VQQSVCFDSFRKLYSAPMAESSDAAYIPLQRSPFSLPSLHVPQPLEFCGDYDICFRHPGYKDPYDILIILPGLDHPQGGIHHETARLACAVVVNNNFDGWLTEDRDGRVRPDVPLDGILRKQNYYFHISNDRRGKILTGIC
jgi:hypothetical protein